LAKKRKTLRPCRTFLCPVGGSTRQGQKKISAGDGKSVLGGQRGGGNHYPDSLPWGRPKETEVSKLRDLGSFFGTLGTPGKREDGGQAGQEKKSSKLTGV